MSKKAVVEDDIPKTEEYYNQAKEVRALRRPGRRRVACVRVEAAARRPPRA